jgi:SulP family sulfate permease
MGRIIFPAFERFRDYKIRTLKDDLSAGFIVAVMLVPQGMAYAMLAGLPPVMGLYASVFPLIVYAIFGSSRQLAVGPVAMISLLVFTGVSRLAEPASEQYLGLVFLLALIVGTLQFAMGLLRAGVLINFLSGAVISGFTSAAAIIIILSQVHHLFGIDSPGGHSALHLIMGISRQAGNINMVTVATGLTSVALMGFLKMKGSRFPAPLLVVAASIAATWLFHLDRFGVAIVGHVPHGFPSFSIPPMDMESFLPLLPVSLTILFVGFMESFSIAKWVAAREKYKIDANRELVGLGLANITASLSSAFPVTGGLSRTVVNYEAGAKTGFASITSALIILLTLNYFASLFYYLPKAALAAIVIVAVTGLIDIKEAKRLFYVKHIDGWTMVATFFTTLLLGTEKGIITGVAFSLFIFVWRSAHPHIAELGYLQKEGIFRNIKRFPEGKIYPDVLILRVDASLYFANMSFLEDMLQQTMGGRKTLKWVIMDLSGVNDVDGVAMDTLEKIMEAYRYRGVEFLFAAMKGPVRDLTAKAGWAERYGQQMGFNTIHDALDEIKRLSGTEADPTL